MKPIIWVPTTYAGVSVEYLFSSSVLPGDSMTTQCQEEVYTKIFQIEDKDNNYPGYDYYPFVTTYKALGDVHCRLLSKDDEGRKLYKIGLNIMIHKN